MASDHGNHASGIVAIEPGVIAVGSQKLDPAQPNFDPTASENGAGAVGCVRRL